MVIFAHIKSKDVLLCKITGPREHNSLDRDMHYYMQSHDSNPRTPHLFTLKKMNSNN